MKTLERAAVLIGRKMLSDNQVASGRETMVITLELSGEEYSRLLCYLR